MVRTKTPHIAFLDVQGNFYVALILHAWPLKGIFIFKAAELWGWLNIVTRKPDDYIDRETITKRGIRYFNKKID